MNTKLIYYFSGTGNSLYAAIEIAKKIKPCKVISMGCEPKEVPATEADVIGFVFPTHHWSMPTFVKKYIERLSINKNAYIFVISSCGGLSINSLNDFNKIIAAKGATVSYNKIHNIVASYVGSYEPFPNPEKRLPQAAADIKAIADAILQKKCNMLIKNTPVKEFLRLIVIPFVKKLPQMDKHFNVSSNCISCGICSQVCIPANIIMKGGSPVFKHQCTQCMACIVFCPKHAINYKDKTQTRTKYHHPNITAKMLLEKTMDF